MKKLIYSLLGIFLSLSISAQTNFYAPTSDLTDTELQNISDAKEDIDAGDNMLATADNMKQQYNSLFSGNTRKKKKAEKKTVPAKKNIMVAGRKYSTGYTNLYNIYLDKLNGVVFEFSDDATFADEKKEEAEKLLTDGTNLINQNINYSDKDLQKTVKFSNLRTNIFNGKEKQKQAIEKLVEALDRYEQQSQKKDDLIDADNKAWQAALLANTIDACEEYITNYPNGLHVAEAEAKIQDITDKILAAQNTQGNPDVVYHIQIAASKNNLTDGQIKNRIYFTNEEIIHFEEGAWHKYYIGEFSSYWDAHTYRKTMGRTKTGTTPFIIAFVNGTKVPIEDALSAEGIDPATIDDQY